MVWVLVVRVDHYSCGLSKATIEYSYVCQSVSLSVLVSICVCVHDNSKNNGLIHLKLVVYEKSSNEFDIGYCLIKLKVSALARVRNL